MKFIITLLVVFPAFAGQVPSSWIRESGNKSVENLEGLTKSFSNILNLQEGALNQSQLLSRNLPKQNFSSWSLKGQKTDLAISRSGLFGLSAVKGTSAVELSWKMKSTKEDVQIATKSDVLLDTRMNEKQVLAAVRPFYKVLLKNNKKSEFKWRAKNFEDHVLRYHRALKSISPLVHRQFVPSKFRLDLTSSYSSPLFGISDLSGDMRVRLEWKIARGKKGSTNQHHVEDREVVKNLLLDLGSALENVDTPKGYKLKTIGVGLGISKGNFLSFSNVKAGITGELFFTKTKKSMVDYIDGRENMNGLYRLETGKGNKILSSFTRRKFRKGIKKSFSISKWFSKRLSRQQFRKWEVNKMKASFSLSNKGFLGLADTTSKSLVSFTFVK